MARWPWGSGAVHWPQILDLPKILPSGRHTFKPVRAEIFTPTPTLHAQTGVKEAFYGDLHNLLQHTDFNARAGREFEVWKGVLDSHGIGNCKDNGRLHLEFCSEHQLVITHHHHHQYLNREGRWGTTDDFATSFLHFPLFSTALWGLAELQACPFPYVVFPPLLLFALSSSPFQFHCALEDSFGQT